MAEDDDQRHVERVSSQTVPEVKIARPEAGVGERTVDLQNQFPQFEWVDHLAHELELNQAQEQMKRTQMIMKRNVSDSLRAEARGKARTWKNWQRRRKNNISTLILRCLLTRHGE